MATPQPISEEDLYENPPMMWRTKLRSGRGDVDPDEQEEYCFNKGKIGVGWAFDDWESGLDSDEVRRLVEDVKGRGWGRQAANTINRFANEAQENDLIWVRDRDGLFRVCQLRGKWNFDNSPAARKVDIHQVRSVAWAPEPFPSLEVPGAVVRAFAGRQAAFQRIKSENARAYSVELWNDANGFGQSQGRPPIRREDLLDYLDPIDLEDLIYVWFQYEHGYLMVPGERSPSTPKTEWAMIHRDTMERAVIQVKSGNTQVNVEELHRVAKKTGAQAWVFSPEALYSEEKRKGVRYIKPEDLLAFGLDNLPRLPERVSHWFKRSGA